MCYVKCNDITLHDFWVLRFSFFLSTQTQLLTGRSDRKMSLQRLLTPFARIHKLTHYTTGKISGGFRLSCAAWASWGPARCPADGRGMRQRTTALKANNVCVDLLRRELIVVQGNSRAEWEDIQAFREETMLDTIVVSRRSCSSVCYSGLSF